MAGSEGINRSAMTQKSSSIAWMGVAYCTALAAGVAILAMRGAGERGVSVATTAVARVAFVFFWLTYVGGALALLFGRVFEGLARHRREFGLAFAAALLVHLTFVAWLFRISAQQPLSNAWIVYFAIGAVSTYALALGSVKRFRGLLRINFWRVFSTVALEYIAFLFFRDFVLLPLQGGVGLPLGDLPFAVLIIFGALLRLAATVRFWGAYGQVST
jgi:hypothetical protein